MKEIINLLADNIASRVSDYIDNNYPEFKTSEAFLKNLLIEREKHYDSELKKEEKRYNELKKETIYWKNLYLETLNKKEN